MSLPNGEYRTIAGSRVTLSGPYGGSCVVSFKEENACCDCAVNEYPSEDGYLVWRCKYHEGGKAQLHRQFGEGRSINP